jgi:8-oxo-dGTP pyrophosphatase MutT (NUDIX family)
MDTQAVIRRQVARVLLFDEQDRVLLFHVRDPAEPTGDAWWYLPGGGMDPRESPEQAARRELSEETGIEDAEIGPVVLERRGVRFRFAGRDYEQDEWLVFGRLPEGGVITGGSDDLEAHAVAAHRWWTLADLAATADLIYPEGLVTIVGRLLREGPPPVLWEVDRSDGITQDVTSASTDAP